MKIKNENDLKSEEMFFQKLNFVKDWEPEKILAFSENFEPLKCKLNQVVQHQDH